MIKLILFGISVMLYGNALINCYASVGETDLGLGVTLVGLCISFIGLILKENKK